MAETRLVFRSNEKLGAAEHLLHHNAGGVLDLHHALKLYAQVLGTLDVEDHAAHVALVHRTHHLGHHGVAGALGKGY